MGIFLPGLYYPDRERARRLPERMPSSERAKIAFWDGYVSGKMYSHALEDLAGCDEFMDWPVAQNPDLARTQEAAAGHAMLAYFCDLAHADGIVERVLQKNDQGAAGLRAGRPRPGRQARRSGLQVKAGRPVEAPLPEKPQLDAWLASTPPGDAATTLYRDHMTQYPGMINAAYGPVYKLAGYAGGFPLQVAGCLAFLMPKHAGSAVPDEACEIWEALRGSKDPRIGALCKKIKPMLKASCRHGAGPAA